MYHLNLALAMTLIVIVAMAPWLAQAVHALQAVALALQVAP